MTANKDLNDSNVSSSIQEAAKTGSLTTSQFELMLAVLLKKEAKLAEQENALEVARAGRDAMRKQESENYTATKIENQTRCKHLKGGASRSRAQQRDPNVFLHTFTDGTRVIKCHGCQARWLPKDTDEYLTRNGSQMPNWTGIGWRRALEMCDDSSNKPSSSERFSTNALFDKNRPNNGVATPPNFQI
jgi:hypothetical protein